MGTVIVCIGHGLHDFSHRELLVDDCNCGDGEWVGMRMERAIKSKYDVVDNIATGAIQP